MIHRPDVVALDLNETLSDFGPLRRRFEQVGAGAPYPDLLQPPDVTGADPPGLADALLELPAG